VSLPSRPGRDLTLLPLFVAALALLAAGATCATRAAAQSQGAILGGSLPGPLPIFPADNWWNLDVSQAPVDPSSASYISFVGAGRGMHPDFGGDSTPFPEIYGMVFMTVPGGQPLEPVVFDYADESDPGAPGRPAGYPIPVEARSQPKWIEGGYPGSAGAGGDKHMLIVDRDRRVLFETWDTRYNGAAGRWEAGSGAVFPLDSNARRPDGWTSADAAGLAILPGLVRYDEAFGPDPIRHALRVTVRSTNGYVWPASHRAGGTGGALPMGARLRLKASKDISGFAEPARKIFQAMKTYGLIVADNGSDLYVQGAYDTRWSNDVLNPAFSAVKGSDFEVVQFGWKPAGGGGGGGGGGAACVPGDSTLCLLGNRFRVEASFRDYSGTVGAAGATPLTADTGALWFFGGTNLELMVKIVSFCGSGVNRYAVYAGGLTDVEVALTVTDTKDGTARSFTNQLGTLFLPVRDAPFACP
jgi:hypothetical protein